MLNFYEINNPNAIETYICEAMQAHNGMGKLRELSELEFKMLAMCMELKTDDLIIKHIAKGKKENLPFIYLVLLKRKEVGVITANIHNNLLLFIGLISENPAIAIQYMWYLQYKAKKLNSREIDLETFCQKILPSGLFLEDNLKAIWYEAKVNTKGHSLASDNLADYTAASLSIQF